MNEDAMKTLTKEEKHRKAHPYWIYESVAMIPDILAQCSEEKVQSQIEHVVDEIKTRKIERIYLLGRGSSYFLTLGLRYLFEAVTDIPISCFVTNLFDAYPSQRIDARSAVFIHSTSGKSEGDKKIVEFANGCGAYTVAVTDIEGTPLATTVDDVIMGPGGAKVELPATRTYASAMFRMAKCIFEIGKRQGNESQIAPLEKQLLAIPEILRDFMPAWEKQAADIARAFKDASAFFVVAYGPNYATADEGALAFAQCAGVPGMSYELENYIHGPIQALTPEMGVVGIAPGGPLQDRMLRAMMASKTIGAKTLIIAPEDADPMPYADIFMKMPAGIHDVLSPIVYMIPLWQIAYQFALLGKGGHPDRLMMDKPEFQKGFTFLMKKDKWVA